MYITRYLKSAIAICAVLAPSAITAQSEDFILDRASFVVVPGLAAGDNDVEFSATTDSDNSVSIETFTSEVQNAFEAGTGGVLTFEVFFPGDSLRDVDKTLVIAYLNDLSVDALETPENLRDLLYNNPEVDDPIDDLWYNPGDPVEDIIVTDPDTGLPIPLIDPNRTILVEKRTDRQSLTSTDPALNQPGPLSPEVTRRFANLVAVFGEENEKRLLVRRGPLNYHEGSLATSAGLASRDYDDAVNDEYYFGINATRFNVQAISGESLMAGGGSFTAGAKDLLFDARDQVRMVGFVVPSFNNFQYWQGNNPNDNPDNLIVDATFSDGTTAVYTGTTQQSAGGADIFFGIKSPGDSYITRIQVRVVGRNFRTFTNIDDFGFIVEPAPPYILEGVEAAGAVGRDFFHPLAITGDPTSVVVTNLPDGVTFDNTSFLFSGIPTSEGEITSQVTMTNGQGESVEEVTFSFTLPVGDAPVITSGDPPPVLLGGEFSYEIETTTKTENPDAQITYFIKTRRVDPASGAEVPFELIATGLTLSDGFLTGTPLQASAVGQYKIDLFAGTSDGFATKTITLDILPKTLRPNLDGAEGNTFTDIVAHDKEAGIVKVALFPQEGEITFENVLTGLPADSVVLAGDLNADTNTDIITYAPSVGVPRAYLMSGTTILDTLELGNFGPDSDWTILEVGDVDLDGVDDLLLQDTVSGWTVIWLIGADGLVARAPFVFDFSDPIREVVLFADFDGNGTQDGLWRNQDGSYLFTPFSPLSFVALDPFSGIDKSVYQAFIMEPGYVPILTADVDGNGTQDIFWENAGTETLAVWLMSGAEVPEVVYVPPAVEGEPGTASAGTNTYIVPPDEVVSIAGTDLNGDNFGDLILQRPSGGAYWALLFSDGVADDNADPDFMLDGVTARPLQLRRDADGAQDLQRGATKSLLDNYPVPNVVPLALEPDEALLDYQIYEQARDGEGELLWTIDGFHAFPVADATRPLPGRDVFFDGMHGPEEALANYGIFVRDGDDAEGRPKPLRSNFGIPRAKRVDKPRVDPDTEDSVWIPVDPSEDGIDYDDRGRRAFLQAVDLVNNLQFDEFGDPVYVPWTNSAGETVPDEPGNVPWELDFERSFASEIAPANENLAVRSFGDFDGNGTADIVYEDTVTGEFFIYLMDGYEVLGIVPFSGGFPAPDLITPDSPFREIEVTSDSRWVVWQRYNYGTESNPDASEGEDPDFDLATNLHEYGSGVEDVFLLTPRPVLPSYSAGSPFVASFDVRSDDPALQVILEVSADMASWSPVAYTETSRSFVDSTTDRVTVETDDLPVGEALFYRVRFVLGAP